MVSPKGKAAGKTGGPGERLVACFMLVMETEIPGDRDMGEVYSLGCNVSCHGFSGSSLKFANLFVPQLPFYSPYLTELFLRLI